MILILCAWFFFELLYAVHRGCMRYDSNVSMIPVAQYLQFQILPVGLRQWQTGRVPDHNEQQQRQYQYPTLLGKTPIDALRASLLDNLSWHQSKSAVFLQVQSHYLRESSEGFIS